MRCSYILFHPCEGFARVVQSALSPFAYRTRPSCNTQTKTTQKCKGAINCLKIAAEAFENGRKYTYTDTAPEKEQSDLAAPTERIEGLRVLQEHAPTSCILSWLRASHSPSSFGVGGMSETTKLIGSFIDSPLLYHLSFQFLKRLTSR